MGICYRLTVSAIFLDDLCVVTCRARAHEAFEEVASAIQDFAEEPSPLERISWQGMPCEMRRLCTLIALTSLISSLHNERRVQQLRLSGRGFMETFISALYNVHVRYVCGQHH